MGVDDSRGIYEKSTSNSDAKVIGCINAYDRSTVLLKNPAELGADILRR
jgi:hypothetical protein